MQYTIVDDNVEVAPVYKCDGKATQPTRPHENHGLAIEHLPTWTESCGKLQSSHLQSLFKDHWVNLQNPGMQGTQLHITAQVMWRHIARCKHLTLDH